MSSLTCDICGGVLETDSTGEFGICESCGMKHSKARIKTKVQEIKGVVEVTKGDAEKERLLKNAEIFMKLGEFSKAERIASRLINDYPVDIECRLFYIRLLFLKLDSRFSKEDYENLALTSDKNLAYCSLLDEIEKAKVLDGFCVVEIDKMWIEFNQRHICHIEELTKNDYPLFALWDLLMCEHEKYDHVNSTELYKASFGSIIKQYAESANKLFSKCQTTKLINILLPAKLCFFPELNYWASMKFELRELKQERQGCYYYNGGFCKEYINEIISIDYLSQTEVICFVKLCDPEISWRKKQIYVRFTKPFAIDELVALINSALTQKEQMQEIIKRQEEEVKKIRKSDCKCQYCGGEFKGIFKKVCSQCGKPKDY